MQIQNVSKFWKLFLTRATPQQPLISPLLSNQPASLFRQSTAWCCHDFEPPWQMPYIVLQRPPVFRYALEKVNQAQQSLFLWTNITICKALFIVSISAIFWINLTVWPPIFENALAHAFLFWFGYWLFSHHTPPLFKLPTARLQQFVIVTAFLLIA